MRHYKNVQAMRGIAAIMVCFVHSVALPVGVGIGNLVPFWGAVGPAGVDLFFVISGFIISTVAANAGGAAVSRGKFNVAREFALKRIARIYPAYWVVFILASIAAPYVWLSPDSVLHVPIWRIFFLIDVNNYRVMSAWTLVYELFFYLVVTVILLVTPRNVFKGLFAWAFATITVIVILEVAHAPENYVVPLSPVLIEFMLGVCVAYLLRRGVSFSPIGAISTGVFLFAIGAYENNALGPWQPWIRTIAFGPAAALILYGVVAAEMNNGWTFWRPWQKLGDASYSIYIWHQLLFFTFMTLAQKAGFALGPLYVGATIAIVISWGFLSYRYFENPVRWKLEKIASTGLNMGSLSPVKFAKNAAILVVIITLPAFAILKTPATGRVVNTVAVKNQQAQLRLEPTAGKIVAALAGDKSVFAAAAQAAGLAPDPILFGYFDNVVLRSPSTIFMQGWAADRGFSGRAVDVLFFQCGSFLGAAAAGDVRLDVAAVLKASRNGFGFHATVPRKQCLRDDIFALIITQDRHYGLMSAAAPRR